MALAATCAESPICLPLAERAHLNAPQPWGYEASKYFHRANTRDVAACENPHFASRAAQSKGLRTMRDDSRVNYGIAAIPTTYRGRRYRSRLEARWAAFFDLIGWRHEYEPFDLGGWSPDFLIYGGPPNTLAEVKPITDYNRSIGCRMHDNAKANERNEYLLLLGTSPLWLGLPFLGWVADEFGDGKANFKMFANGSTLAVDYALRGNPTGLTTGFNSYHYPEDLQAEDQKKHRIDLIEQPRTRQSAYERLYELWTTATNAVQWQGEAR